MKNKTNFLEKNFHPIFIMDQKIDVKSRVFQPSENQFRIEEDRKKPRLSISYYVPTIYIVSMLSRCFPDKPNFEKNYVLFSIVLSTIKLNSVIKSRMTAKRSCIIVQSVYTSSYVILNLNISKMMPC